MRVPGFPRSAVVACATLALLLAACSGSGSSFDPTASCTADGRFSGAYPALEQRLPSTFENTQPSRVDSGRNCTAENLGSLASHGLSEVHFAGAVFELAPQTGLTISVFTAPGLQSDWMGEFYDKGIQSARKVTNLVVTHPQIGGGPGYRLDYLDSDQPQTIVAWPSAQADSVNVVLAAGVPDRIVQEAIATLH